MATAVALTLTCVVSACNTPPRSDASSSAAQATRPTTYGLGHQITAQEIAAVDIDVNPAGTGLPVGEGTASAGSAIFAQKCAFCHGPRGEGQGPYPRLIGRTPPPGFVSHGGCAVTCLFIVSSVSNTGIPLSGIGSIVAGTLPAVQMPARKNFVPDNRTGGAAVR